MWWARRSCVHQAGDDVVDGDGAGGTLVGIEDREHAEIVLVEEFEDVLLGGVHGNGDQRIGFEFGHELLAGGKEHAGDRNGAGKAAEFVDENDGVELLEIELLCTEPGEDHVASFGLADERKLRVHHAASSGGIEGQEFADLGGFLVGHFFEEFLRRFPGQIGKEVGSGVRGHFLDDVGGLFGIEFFDDLRGEALVQFGEDGRGGLLVERGDNALALGSGKFLHHFGEIGGVEILKLFVSDAELDAAKRVGLDEIDEFPPNVALWEPTLEATDKIRGSHTLKEATNGARESDVDLGDAEFEVAVGAGFGEVDVIDADHFAASGVDDLLVEEVFLDGEEGLVGVIGFEGALGDVEIDAAGNDGGDLIVAGDERLEASARDEEVRDAVGLIGGLHKEFADTADIVGIGIIGGGAHQFRGVEHRSCPF